VFVSIKTSKKKIKETGVNVHLLVLKYK